MGVKAIAGEVLGKVVLFSFCSVFVVKQFAKFSLLTVKGSPVRAFGKIKTPCCFVVKQQGVLLCTRSGYDTYILRENKRTIREYKCLIFNSI